MELKIESITKAKALIAKDWPTHIISIINEAGGDFGPSTIDRQHDDHYIYSFHDVENDESEELAHEYVVPKRQDMVDILEAAAMVPKDGKLLVHCTAGKSRSTAAAMGILIQSGMTPQEAFDKVKMLQPSMFPNRLMIEYVDDILDLQGTLVSIVKTYYAEKLHLFPKLVEINRGGYNR
jgi:predicted protein tyrosine phosphatase